MLTKLSNDMKQAMRSKDKAKLLTIRSLISEIKKTEIDTRKKLTDDEILAILSKAVKSRKDSSILFRQGNRPELAEKEEMEIEIINGYLPKKLSESEIESIIDELIKETGASSMKDMGMIMKEFKIKYANKADGRIVSTIVKSKLS